VLGSVFLWAFLDKAFGLGYATPREGSWFNGGSPASGYLASRQGTFGDLFQGMAGQAWVDWSFMLGMLLVGTALVLGVALWPAAVGATALMGMLWLSALPLENNPAVDDHLVYIAAAVALAATRAGDTLGLGRVVARLKGVPGWLA
jgi:thiosulfate dehydrogenase [quinone] large subunit